VARTEEGTTMTRAALRARLALVAGLAATALVAGSTGAGAAPAGRDAPAAPGAPAASPLTNLAHLDFLLDTTTPPPTPGHTTYRLAEDPALTLPWTYADARPGGTFERVGGGALDPATGDYGQGAFNTDDVARAAVVYVRHWELTGDASSRAKAYELLRSVAYLQTAEGPDAGNVVLWMQRDGELNPSAEPVELPDPSDSANSYWLARSLWAFGEGYAAFRDADPAFAAFLGERVRLGVAALERDSLARYGTWASADGMRVPTWLVADGADASAEAVLGLAAYADAAPDGPAPRTALTKLADGIAAMSAGDLLTWPYGAVLPWTQSRSLWHAWGSQMPAALARASQTLGRHDLLRPALADSTAFTPTLLAAGGPDNAWLPTPIDRTQIAYGADSRVQSLLAVGDASGSAGVRTMAAAAAAWFFGANASGAPVYDPATGVTYDGVAADGTVNRNSGAESTIHGLLTMLALDARPDLAALARASGSVTARDGLTVVEAEGATGATVVTPESAWTGESQWSGGAALRLRPGQSATLAIPAGSGLRHVEPVVLAPERGAALSTWSAGRLPLGAVAARAGSQGVTAVPGALLPLPLHVPVGSRAVDLTVRAKGATDTTVDAVLLRPLVQRLVLGGGVLELASSTSRAPLPARVGTDGVRADVAVYRADGSRAQSRHADGVTTVLLPPGGFALVTGRP
jgi:hypothetical protein